MADPLIRKMVPVSEDLLLLLNVHLETSVANELKRGTAAAADHHLYKIDEVLVFVEGMDEMCLREIPLPRHPYDTVVREAASSSSSVSSSSQASSLHVKSPRAKIGKSGEGSSGIDNNNNNNNCGVGGAGANVPAVLQEETDQQQQHQLLLSDSFSTSEDGVFRRRQTSLSRANSILSAAVNRDKHQSSIASGAQQQSATAMTTTTTVTRKYCSILNLCFSRKLIRTLKKKRLSQVSLRYDLMVPVPENMTAKRGHVEHGTAVLSPSAVKASKSPRKEVKDGGNVDRDKLKPDYICIASVEVPYFVLVKSKYYRRMAKKQDIQSSLAPFAEMLIRERQTLDQSEVMQIEMENIKRKFHGRINRVISGSKEREDQLQQSADEMKKELEHEQSKVSGLEELVDVLKRNVRELELQLAGHNGHHVDTETEKRKDSALSEQQQQEEAADNNDQTSSLANNGQSGPDTLATIERQERQICELRELVSQLKTERKETLELIKQLQQAEPQPLVNEHGKLEEMQSDSPDVETLKNDSQVAEKTLESEIKYQKRQSLSRLQRIVFERKQLFESMSIINDKSEKFPAQKSK